MVLDAEYMLVLLENYTLAAEHYSWAVSEWTRQIEKGIPTADRERFKLAVVFPARQTAAQSREDVQVAKHDVGRL